MATEVKVPVLGESVTEATVGEWLKQVGDAVAADEPIASLETDKVAVEVPSPVAGIISGFSVELGATVEVGAVIATVEEGGTPAAKPKADKPAETTSEPAPAGDGATTMSPAVRRAVLEHGVDPTTIKGTGKDGRLQPGRWDVGTIANTVAGREWAKQSEGRKRTWGVSGRINTTGGQRYTPVLEEAMPLPTPYSKRYNSTYRMDLRIYLKRERHGRTGMWALDLLNATNAQNEAYRYYDQRKGEVVTRYQLGLIPNLSYRVEF